MHNRIIDCAIQALIDEATLAPKPGLVDPMDAGSHSDMDYALFLKSAQALRPSFEDYLSCGLSHTGNEPSLFRGIRPLGLVAEQQMFAATNDINTHKGANFLFGISLAAIGYGAFPDIPQTLNIIQKMTAGLVQRELVENKSVTTFGEKIYHSYGVTGIRGQVESGLKIIEEGSLLIMKQAEKSYETRLKEALIHLIQVNDDTNMLKRGGLRGLQFGKKLAAYPNPNLDEKLSKMNALFKMHHLSPGGSADLLSLSAFLHNYQRLREGKDIERL